MSSKTQVVIVTGANSGVGLEASKQLSADGWEVIVACRSPEKGQSAVEEIKKKQPDANVSFMRLDLADLTSIRQFVDNFHKTGKKLNTLVNNAGVWMNNEKCLTKDGFEMTIGTNHLGHFLLTNLLLEDLKATAASDGEARIVNVASLLHDNTVKAAGNESRPINMDDLMYEKEDNKYTGSQAYKDSKLMNVLFTYELAKRLEGTGVTANVLCPGWIPSTGLNKNFPYFVQVVMKWLVVPIMRWKGRTTTVEEAGNIVLMLTSSEHKKGFIPSTNLGQNFPCFLRCCMRCCIGPLLTCSGVAHTLAQGGSIVNYLASSQNQTGVTGKYYTNGEEKKSSEESYNEDYQKKLRDISSELVKL